MRTLMQRLFVRARNTSNLRGRKGSAAMLIIPLFLAIFIFVGVAVNYGQITRVHIESSTAADFGCLAAASWAGSGATECALITNNINSILTMMQALYLVPFCPEGEPYAQELLASFTLPEGPLTYYQKTCKGVMEEGRKQGGAYFTAACYNSFLTGHGDSMDMGLVEANRENPNGATFDFSWSVSRMGITYSHEASCSLTGYPSEFYAELVSDPLDFNYLVWEPQPGSFSHYNCDPTGKGISDGKLARMADEDLVNPLEIVADNGPRKAYEVDFSEPIAETGNGGRVPQPVDVVYEACPSKVCGMRSVAANIPEAIPVRITPEAGITVSTEATHQVDQSGGMTAVYTPVFPLIEHGATCEAKPYPQPGQFPTYNMKIELTGTS